MAVPAHRIDFRRPPTSWRGIRLSIAVATIVLSSCGARADDSPPNILLILTDDQGWSQLSQVIDARVPDSASTYLETPRMNQLAREGMRFTSAYSPAPLCTPTRRSILCGTSSARSGGEFRSTWVPADHLTIPRALKMANPGYQCAHFGKWGEQMVSTPSQCGYVADDGMTGNITGGMPKSLGVQSGSHTDGPPHFIDDNDPKRTRSVTDRAVNFMRKQVRAEKPFYVQVSYYAQHLSVVCSTETLKKYEEKGTPDRGYTQAWAAMMEELDDGVGELLDAIDEQQIADNTYVFFTSDNGGRGTIPGGDETRPAPNHPLTGAKHSLYEGGVRVPLFVRGPGIERESVCDTPVVGYDFLPTFFELAGGTAKLADEVDGTSIVPLLRDPTATAFQRPHGAIFFHRPSRRLSAIRQNTDKLLIFWTPKGKIRLRELYRVDTNPREEGFNILPDNSQRADELESLLLAHLKDVNAEAPMAPVNPGKAQNAANNR